MSLRRVPCALAALALGMLACNLTTYTTPPAPTLTPTVIAIPASTSAARAGASTPPGGGNVVFVDGFDTRAGRWRQFDDADAVAWYEQARFRIDVKPPGHTASSAPDVDLMAGDAVFAVEATLLDGAESAQYGLAFRLQGSFDMYLFSVTGGGAYTFSRLEAGVWETLIPLTASAAVAAGPGATNVLSVRAAGDAFTFLVNETPVAQAQDGALAVGGVGLVVATGEVGGAAVAFDNVSVVALP
ncbi:MAG: hypothetical protein M5R40_04615 [Anaerolineae bacterium]|nr:hypothetical protein [Anaerolineae bacterium]